MRSNTSHCAIYALVNVMVVVGIALVCTDRAWSAEVTSIADWPCPTWSARREAGDRTDAPQMWLSGYLTGLATAHRIDVLAITDAPRIFDWIDSYCAASPNTAISTGAAILFHDLAGRLPRGPARQL